MLLEPKPFVDLTGGIHLFLYFVRFSIRYFGRPQDQQQQQQQQQLQQQQQQGGIAPVRLIGSAINASNRQRPATVNVANTNVGIATNNPNIVGNMLPQHVPISYYTHSAPQTSYFNDVLHPMQVTLRFCD